MRSLKKKKKQNKLKLSLAKIKVDITAMMMRIKAMMKRRRRMKSFKNKMIDAKYNTYTTLIKKIQVKQYRAIKKNYPVYLEKLKTLKLDEGNNKSRENFLLKTYQIKTTTTTTTTTIITNSKSNVKS